MQNDKDRKDVVQLNVYTYIFLHLFPLKLIILVNSAICLSVSHTPEKKVIKNGSYEGLTLPKL